MEPLNTSAVAIDGLAVRKIREEKRLTQFYVSKVVGVTTDTVSRWENNRYPTIMRDNALKLAEALEVELDDILKKEVEAADQPESSVSAVKKRRWLPLLAVVAIIFVGLSYFVLRPAPEATVILQAKRIVPPYAAPSSQILIRVNLSVDKPLKGMILKETFPAGWRLIEAQPVVSHIDSETGKARWIFRKPPQKITVYYLLQVPDSAKAGDNLTIHGELKANPDGQRTATTVDTVGHMQIKPFHWADTNGDGAIDDLEILEVSDLTEEAASLNLDWDLIESIWEMGSYQWRPEQKAFVPLEPPAEQ